MNLATVTQDIHFHTLFRQNGDIMSSSNTFQKIFLEQITAVETSYFNFSFSDFENVFKLEIADVVWDGFSEEILFKLEYDTFFVHLTLKGFWELDEEQKFQLQEIDWNFEEKENNPTSAFTLNTFIALLCLSNKVKVEIPIFDYFFRVSVPSPINKISEILQNRQLAYRLMVIEKAFQISLPFPKRFIAGEEVGNIAFCYYAVVERQFEWACNSFTLFPSASVENLKYFPNKNTSYHLTFPTLNEKRLVFNKELFLGQFMIDIEKALIENYEEVMENFNKFDGQPIKTIIKPLNGKIKYTAFNAPHLPEKPWNIELQKLLDLDEQFNSAFLKRYFDLAADTLKGLSDEQKESITERPKLSIKGLD